jgi:hypothetical protein
MAFRACNDRAGFRMPFGGAISTPVETGGGRKAQAGSRFTFPLWGALLAAFLLTHCAPGPGPEGSRSPATSVVMPVDAVLPLAEGWRVFSLGMQRHARVSDARKDWSGSEAWPWLVLTPPSGPFRPVQVIMGWNGSFYLVDAASARLCLYDTAAALLSTFPLPETFTPFPAARAAVFRGADGAFTFIDYGSGEAFQYSERRTTDAGAARWVDRGKVKLPAGTGDCEQPPGSTDLFCRGGDGGPLRFDGALNRLPPSSGEVAGTRGRWRVLWDPAKGQWVKQGLSTDGRPLFQHHATAFIWTRIPEEFPSAPRPDSLLIRRPPGYKPAPEKP